MSDDADKIKLELPSKLQAFSFTFETKRPGPMSKSRSDGPPSSPDYYKFLNMSTSARLNPKLLTNFKSCAGKRPRNIKQKSAAGTVARIDTEETFDSSDTEKETPAEFTCWYKAKKALNDIQDCHYPLDPGLIFICFCSLSTAVCSLSVQLHGSTDRLPTGTVFAISFPCQSLQSQLCIIELLVLLVTKPDEFALESALCAFIVYICTSSCFALVNALHCASTRFNALERTFALLHAHLARMRLSALRRRLGVHVIAERLGIS
ncbi:hypothetical protein F4604DRAFT_1936097 [Suillus subluteus]|nr:hypothetical protein F4604DRAFT_1936097 [Suillus subluteus]